MKQQGFPLNNNKQSDSLTEIIIIAMVYFNNCKRTTEGLHGGGYISVATCSVTISLQWDVYGPITTSTAPELPSDDLEASTNSYPVLNPGNSCFKTLIKRSKQTRLNCAASMTSRSDKLAR